VHDTMRLQFLYRRAVLQTAHLWTLVAAAAADGARLATVAIVHVAVVLTRSRMTDGQDEAIEHACVYCRSPVVCPAAASEATTNTPRNHPIGSINPGC